jgi:UDP-N-acetylmuramoyl-tripeptide--D-alanyl-D-alanine ligase
VKKKAKAFIARKLGKQVLKLRKRNKITVIAVSGSIGKTSTKLALAHILSKGFNVRYQKGNYNDLISVPLIFFGREMPNIFNPFAWAWIYIRNQFAISKEYPYDIVVVELGSDGPGQIQEFSNYLQVDIAVLTAITPEHMEYFGNLEAVAKEELSITNFANKIYANKDLIPTEYLGHLPDGSVTYGVKQEADVRLTNVKWSGEEATFDINFGGINFLHGEHERVTEPQLYSICAAVAVATELEMPSQSIGEGIRELTPVSGRMQHLHGLSGSIIIDDTYNASPEAVKGALDTLYRLESPQKIAILGNMNELGEYSKLEHEKIGEYCDPSELTLVVTIGPDANKYLASAAEKRGCLVKPFNNPVDAGKFVKSRLQNGTIVLAKGSQNGVFAEEAVKQLLALPADSKLLVRQSRYWLKTKRKQFPSVKIG